MEATKSYTLTGNVKVTVSMGDRTKMEDGFISIRARGAEETSFRLPTRGEWMAVERDVCFWIAEQLKLADLKGDENLVWIKF